LKAERTVQLQQRVIHCLFQRRQTLAVHDRILRCFRDRRAIRGEHRGQHVRLRKAEPPLAVQRETAAVRLILAGKQNGFDAENIRERLRDLYV